jgi:hypothetical protein
MMRERRGAEHFTLLPLTAVESESSIIPKASISISGSLALLPTKRRCFCKHGKSERGS